MGERKILAWILKTAQAMVGHSVDHLWIYLRRGVGLDSTLRRFSLPQPASPQIDEGLPGRVARTGVLIACQDVLADESFSQFYLPIFPKTRAQWCFPILAEGCTVRDEHFPVLCLDSQSPIEASLRSILDLLSLLGGLKLSALSGFHRLEQVQKIQDENDRWHLEQQIQELAGIRPEPTIRKLFDTLGSTFGPQGISLWQYNEIEDNLCHPIFSSQAPRVYRDYPRPGPWGAIGRVIASGQPLFCSRVSSAKDLKVSRFMSDLNVQATAYIPARLAIRLPAESVVPTKAKGVLFVNYEEEHRFSRLERKILLYAAEAAVEVLQLRSLARRHRLTEHFDLGEAYAYPGGTPSSEPAARAVLAALVSNHGYPHGVLYIKDRPGSLFVRSVWTSPLGKNFKGRYLESHPLFSLFGERWEPVVIRGEELEKVANVPEALQRGWTLALPLRQETDLLGFCLLSSEAPLSKKIEAEVAAHLPLFRQALETLLDLDRQARSNRRHVSLLAQFLRIYEYAARETSPTPLLTAFLDALLEGSTADACYIYLSSKRSDQDQPTLKVFRGDTSTSAARAMPPAFKTVFETDEPLFETNPVQTAGQRETVSGLEETDAGRVGIVSQVPRHPDVRAQVVLPLRFHQSRYGVLCVEYHVEHVFSAEDQWFFRVLIHQLGQALNYFEGNKILSERVKDLATSGTRIAHLGSPQFQEDVPVEEESRKLAVQAKEFSRADFVELWLLQDGVFVLQASDGADVHRRIGYERWNPETGLVAWVCRNRKPLLAADLSSPSAIENGYIANPAFTGACSELIVPVLDNDQVIAVIDLESRHPGAFDAGEIDFVQAIAAQAVTLRRAAELQKTRKWLDEERKLLVRINSIAQEAEKQGEMAVLKRILDALAQYIEAPFISIHLLTRDGYSFDQARSLSIPDDHSYLRGLNLENSILGRAVQGARERGDKHRLIENVHHPPAGWPPSRRHHADARMAKLVVFLGEGQEMVGVINVEHPDHTVLHRQVGLIEAVGVGVHNALALSDAANRRAGQDFRERIAQETDELIQLLTSTVFHDAPQLVRALQLRLDDLENACYDRGAAFPERAQVEKKWAETRATADRLGRLSAALPSYMRPDRLDLVQIVQETFAAPVLPALSFFEEVRCAVELDVPSSSLYVSESASWLRHILENLAVNAFRALSEHPNPEPKLVVSACTSADGQRVVVQIDDNGPGLPTEVAKKIGLERIASEGRPEQLGIFHQFARKHVQRQGGELVPGRSRLGGCMFELRYPRLT